METNCKPHRKSCKLSLADRVEVIREYDRHTSGPSVRSLARKFGCSPMQIQKILLDRKAILKSYRSINGDTLNEPTNIDDSEQKRQEKIAFLDRVIYEYIQRAIYSNCSINDDKIKLKAFQIKECIDLENFHPTNLWLDNIKETYGIKEFDLESLRDSVIITEEKSSNLTAVDMVEYVRRKDQEAQEEENLKDLNNSKQVIDDNSNSPASNKELNSSDFLSNSAQQNSCKTSQSKECRGGIKDKSHLAVKKTHNSLKRKMSEDQKKDDKLQKFDLTKLPDQILTQNNSLSTCESIELTSDTNNHLEVSCEQNCQEKNLIFEIEKEDLTESPTKLQTQHISSTTTQSVKSKDHTNDSIICKNNNNTISSGTEHDKFHSIKDRASAINLYANGTTVADLAKIFDVSETTVRYNLLYSSVIMQVYNKYYSSDNIQEKMPYDKFIKEIISNTSKKSKSLQYPKVSYGKDSNLKFAQTYNVNEENMQKILVNNKHVIQNYNRRCKSQLNMISTKRTHNLIESKKDFIAVPKQINSYNDVLEALKPVQEFAAHIGNIEGSEIISALEEHIKKI